MQIQTKMLQNDALQTNAVKIQYIHFIYTRACLHEHKADILAVTDKKHTQSSSSTLSLVCIKSHRSAVETESNVDKALFVSSQPKTALRRINEAESFKPGSSLS